MYLVCSCDDLDLARDCGQSFEYLSKKYGINNRSMFSEVYDYDVIHQCPFDIMHTLLEVKRDSENS